uniref:Secreted protein n=1 Tax=Plectus sambesii TaxID=2011161 RepID=A0A914WQV3_9BILA
MNCRIAQSALLHIPPLILGSNARTSKEYAGCDNDNVERQQQHRKTSRLRGLRQRHRRARTTIIAKQPKNMRTDAGCDNVEHKKCNMCENGNIEINKINKSICPPRQQQSGQRVKKHLRAASTTTSTQ